MGPSSGALPSAAIPQQPRRRRIPKWVRISAAIALALVVLLVLGGLWAARYLKRMMDPEVQWAAIRELIAVDEPPPSYAVTGMPDLWEMETWSLYDPARDRFAMFLHVDGEEAARRKRELFDRETREIPGNASKPAVPLEHGTIPVQGRDLRYIRFAYADPRRNLESGTPGRRDRSGPTILVELPCEAPAEFLALMMVAEGGGGRVEDAQIVDFLRPFHVGPDR